MKTYSLALLLVAMFAFVLLGCSENSAPVEASTDQAFSTAASPSALAKAGIVASASGSAQMFFDENGLFTVEKTGEKHVTTFNAVEHDDGTCSGVVSIRITPAQKPTWAIKGEVVQVKVHDNKAKIIYKVIEADAGAEYLLDTYTVFLVIDNGEGQNASPDLTCWVRYTFLHPNWLARTPQEVEDKFTGANMPILPISIGNVQVRGESYPE
jgi:hypothetical protein